MNLSLHRDSKFYPKKLVQKSGKKIKRFILNNDLIPYWPTIMFLYHLLVNVMFYILVSLCFRRYFIFERNLRPSDI